MGLRIVDRQFRTRREVSDAEQLAGIESEARRWAALRTGRPQAQADSKDFVAHFKEVRSRLTSPEHMIEMADKIRNDIKDRHNDSALSHNQVDIATLMELL